MTEVLLLAVRSSFAHEIYERASVSHALERVGLFIVIVIGEAVYLSVTGLAELMRTSQIAAGSTKQYFLFFIVGGALYLVLTTLSDRVFGFAERRVARSFRHSLGRR